MNIGKLQAILDKAVDNRFVFGTSFSIKRGDEIWNGASGNLKEGDQYFIASTTKLFITAIILNFKSRNLLSLDDSIANYLDERIISGLHVFKGEDFSNRITIRHLLSHTSGLPDYFMQVDKSGNSFVKELKRGNDRQWTFEETIVRCKELKPLFTPGYKNRANYSDCNFQLLGKIIEKISGHSIATNIHREVCLPLGLTRTYMFSDPKDNSPQKFYYKSKMLELPLAMTSFGPDGGVVSNSGEMISFIEGFFNGSLFPASLLKELMVWRNIFFPLQSGTGIQRFKLPWILDPLGKVPELTGHSGLSGALAFFNPATNIYISGTVNQVANPGTSFRLALKLINSVN